MQPTRMTRRSSSMRIFGDTWMVNGPPLWEPSGPLVAPYSSAVCCAMEAARGRGICGAVRHCSSAAWQAGCRRRIQTRASMWAVLWNMRNTPHETPPHKLADDSQADGRQALQPIAWLHIA